MQELNCELDRCRRLRYIGLTLLQADAWLGRVRQQKRPVSNDDGNRPTFQQELGAMGYKVQNSSFLGFHAMYLGLFQIARGYREEGVTAFARLQQTQIKTLDNGYRGWKLQSSVGTRYFEDVARTVAGDALSTAASRGSTEESQF